MLNGYHGAIFPHRFTSFTATRCCSNFLLRLLDDFHALVLRATRHTEKMLKAADRISHQGQRALLVLNMLRSSLHFKLSRARVSAALGWRFLLTLLRPGRIPSMAVLRPANSLGERQATISRSRRSSQDFPFLIPALLRRERYVTGPIGSQGFARVFLMRRQKLIRHLP